MSTRGAVWNSTYIGTKSNKILHLVAHISPVGIVSHSVATVVACDKTHWSIATRLEVRGAVVESCHRNNVLALSGSSHVAKRIVAPGARSPDARSYGTETAGAVRVAADKTSTPLAHGTETLAMIYSKRYLAGSCRVGVRYTVPTV